MNFIYKIEIESQMGEQTYGYRGGKELGRDKLGDCNWHIYTLLYIKSITHKDLLCSTENSPQYSVMTFMGKESKKDWRYLIIAESFCCKAESNTTL